jgi:hypothetical protein
MDGLDGLGFDPEILNDIQNLQSIEQQLFSSLEENTGLTTDQQKKIIE